MGRIRSSDYTLRTTASANVTQMNTSSHDKAAGISKSIAGRAKEAAGAVLGNPQLKTEGKVERLEGRVQVKTGQIKKVLGK